MNMQFVVVTPDDRRYTSPITPDIPGWEAAIRHARAFAHETSLKHGPVTIRLIRRISETKEKDEMWAEL